MGQVIYMKSLRSDLPIWSRIAGNLAMQQNGSFEHAVSFSQGDHLQPNEADTLDEVARRIAAARANSERDVEIEIIGYCLDPENHEPEASENALRRANAVAGELALRGLSTGGVIVRAASVASLKRSALIRVHVIAGDARAA